VVAQQYCLCRNGFVICPPTHGLQPVHLSQTSRFRLGCISSWRVSSPSRAGRLVPRRCAAIRIDVAVPPSVSHLAARQLFALTGGFFGPLFFVTDRRVADLRALWHASYVVLVALGGGAILAHLVTVVSGQPVRIGLLACSNRRTRRATALGTQLDVPARREGPAILLGALVTIATASWPVHAWAAVAPLGRRREWIVRRAARPRGADTNRRIGPATSSDRPDTSNRVARARWPVRGGRAAAVPASCVHGDHGVDLAPDRPQGATPAAANGWSPASTTTQSGTGVGRARAGGERRPVAGAGGSPGSAAPGARCARSGGGSGVGSF
jgi:hypothetical protein